MWSAPTCTCSRCSEVRTGEYCSVVIGSLVFEKARIVFHDVFGANVSVEVSQDDGETLRETPRYGATETLFRLKECVP